MTEQQEREAFEAAMRPLGIADMWLERDEAGNYTFARTMDAWLGWQARASLSLPSSGDGRDAEQADADAKNGLAWAVSRWNAEVSKRPLVNVHRRTLDDTWRQVIRYFGGDPVKLIGPAHDDLAAMSQGSSHD